MELVKVRNTGRKPLILRHDAHGDITIAAGKERIVPLDHATVNFGNPGAKNEGKDRVRAAEYSRIRTLWGFYPGIQTEDEWEDERPQAEVYDLDDQRLYFVIDDPDGTLGSNLAGARVSERTDTEFLNDRIGELENQINKLLQVVAAQTGDAVPTPSSTTVPQEPPVTTPADARSGDATPETQEERNEQRDEIPKARAKAVTKDAPRTSRVGQK